MAGQATDYLEALVYDTFFRNLPYSPPTALYAALFTADPGESYGLASEVSGGGYARQPVVFGPITAGIGTESRGVNTNMVQFPVATAPYGTVSYLGVMDAATGGNILSRHPLVAPKTVSSGDDIRFPPGSVVVTVD